ncbi:unannotated protein [freshwater metagenome]|uniref:Unannotated protein n=1 Tax=freshwater metagenome TaxID=449393 RepID=A0A6J7AZA4_9ZZZZ
MALAAIASACIHVRSHARGGDALMSTLNVGARNVASRAGSTHVSAITICVAPVDANHSLTTRDAGRSPTRTTVSGTLAVAKDGTRRIGSACATPLSPLRGSVRTGQPSRRMPAAWRAAPAPATTRPVLARSMTTPPSMRTSAARCQGALRGRPGGSSRERPSNGSRNARFRCTGPGWPPAAPPPAPRATSTACAPSERHPPRPAHVATPGSMKRRTAPPNNDN